MRAAGEAKRGRPTCCTLKSCLWSLPCSQQQKQLAEWRPPSHKCIARKKHGAHRRPAPPGRGAHVTDAPHRQVSCMHARRSHSAPHAHARMPGCLSQQRRRAHRSTSIPHGPCFCKAHRARCARSLMNGSQTDVRHVAVYVMEQIVSTSKQAHCSVIVAPSAGGAAGARAAGLGGRAGGGSGRERRQWRVGLVGGGSVRGLEQLRRVERLLGRRGRRGGAHARRRALVLAQRLVCVRRQRLHM